jgi:spore photoproduct lyase
MTISLPLATEATPAQEWPQQVRRWMPRRVVFTPAALAEPWGRQILGRVEALGLPVEELPANRVTGLKGNDERATYRLAKSTLAVVTAPPSAFKLQPIPPSADWQFHLAEGCPAHCQYCYLAGSLSGPPVVRVFANLPAILDNLPAYERPGLATTFEASCYTDPLALEHLTGSLAETIRHFGARQDGYLRWVSKFDGVDDLLGLPHNGRTRCRVSVNAAPVADRSKAAWRASRSGSGRCGSWPCLPGAAAAGIPSASCWRRSSRSTTGRSTTASCSTTSRGIWTSRAT